MNHALAKTRMPWEEERPILWGVIIAVMVSAIGGSFTPLTEWYYGLTFPSWKPPDWAFGPVWTTIFILTAFAGITAWKASPKPRRRIVLTGFVINGALNILWSVLFFTMQRPDYSLWEMPVLIISILSLMKLAAPAGRWSVLALMPYLLWVLLAFTLNWAIVQDNGPF